MRKFKRMIRNWLNDDYGVCNEVEVKSSRHDYPINELDGDLLKTSINIYYLQGGKILEISTYDSQRNRKTDTFMINESDDLMAELETRLVITDLKR